MPPRTRRGTRRRKKRVAGSADNLRFIGMQETAVLRREIDALNEGLAQCQDSYNALNQEKMEAEFAAE